jgi:hypothetical protein
MKLRPIFNNDIDVLGEKKRSSVQQIFVLKLENLEKQEKKREEPVTK